MTDRRLNRSERRALAAQHRGLPEQLVEVPTHLWPASTVGMDRPPERVWRSRSFLVQQYVVTGSPTRLSINRLRMLANGRWADAITWDEIQSLKAQAGYADRWAVEIFPAARDLVDVANVRHVWLLDEPPAFAWRRNEVPRSLD